jgi:hypothetical protein
VLRLFALILVAAALAFFVSQLAAAPTPGPATDVHRITRETRQSAGGSHTPPFVAPRP